MKKFHNKLGEVEILSQDEKVTLVRLVSGEERKLITSLMNLSDTPFPVEETVVIVARKKKLNGANFMSAEEWAKSKYSTMDKNDFEEERKRDLWSSKSL